jgi:enterochelin esterase-like enzyme
VRPILELAAALQRDPARADDTLREFVTSRQFPLVEGDTATFFFWDGKPVEKLELIHWVFGLESHQEFRRLGRTHAYYLSIDLPSAARVEYKLGLVRQGHKSLIRDPHNPRQAFDPFGSNSVCPMPKYHDPVWTSLEPGAREGRIEEFTFRSAAWGEDRTIQVYLPSEYRPTKKYPLLVCFDGRDYQTYAQIKPVLDNLIHRKEVAPVIVAFTSGHRRNEEYAANPNQAKFVVEEMIPEVERRYGLSADPLDRGLMGASFGGVTSLFTAASYPGKFGRLLLQSGSFVFTDVGRHDRSPLFDPVVAFVNGFRNDVDRLKVGRVKPRIFMSCGTFESLIYYNRSLVPLLREADYEVRFIEAQDGHNWIAWRDRLREGLAWLYPGHLWMHYE